VIPAHDLEAVHESAVRVRLEAGEPSTPVFGLGAGGPPDLTPSQGRRASRAGFASGRSRPGIMGCWR
jgi:hypothetical protein